MTYKYNGKGFIVGIPARDIPQDEFKTMTKEQQEIIKTCGLYKLEKLAEE